MLLFMGDFAHDCTVIIEYLKISKTKMYYSKKNPLL